MKKTKKLVFLLVAVILLSSTASHAGGFNYRVIRVNLRNNDYQFNDYYNNNSYNNSRYNFRNSWNVIIDNNNNSRPGEVIELPTKPVEKPTYPPVDRKSTRLNSSH